MPLGEEHFCEVGRGIRLCYDTTGDPSDPPMLLVMGLGMQLTAWHADLTEQLAERGFHVVRFDNRDAGRSTSIDHARPPNLWQLLTRNFAPEQYTLADMAEDAAGLLRELDLAPAHVVGASLGGMVGQTLAARHPERVRTLSSLMSTTGSRFRGQPSLTVLRYLLKRAPRERERFIEHAVKLWKLIGSPGFPTSDAEIREVAGRSFDRGTNPAGTGRQLAAILKSGNRTKELRSIRKPTLVMHGTKDRLINKSGGRATAKAIPGARLVMIEGWGHDLPRAAWPQIIEPIAEHARAHDREPAAV